MKVSKRFKAIQDFLNVSDQFIDIGSDHAYVPILMAQRGSKKILATDIHAGALKIARKNIMDAGSENVIQTQLADGLSGVVTEGYDTLVIAGMGYFTIEHILKDQEKLKPIKKMILQSNNHLKEVRLLLNKLGYALKDESVVYEKGHYYTIMLFVKESQTLTEVEYFFGLYKEEHKEYYHFLNQEINTLLKKVPEEKKQELLREQALLQNYL